MMNKAWVRNITWITLLLLAAGMIALGWSREEWRTVLNKAVQICFQCIGLG